MNHLFRSVVISAALASCVCAASAQTAPRERTDVYIRRLAGLPASSADGQIEIIDVGHDPMSTMLSIVGNKTEQGWHISYACAASPQCAPPVDHKAVAYTLSPAASAEVDAILKDLASGTEPGGQAPSANFIGGSLLVAINYNGFKRDYRRSGAWGATLGRLEQLMVAPAS